MTHGRCSTRRCRLSSMRVVVVETRVEEVALGYRSRAAGGGWDRVVAWVLQMELVPREVLAEGEGTGFVRSA